MPREINFPRAEPYWVFDRDAIRFPAFVDHRVINCLMSIEAMMVHFGARGPDPVEAKRIFRDHRDTIEQVARRKIVAEDYNPSGEVILKSEDFYTRQTTTQPPPPSPIRVLYPDPATTDAELMQSVRAAGQFLQDELGKGAGKVRAAWEVIPSPGGDTLAQLTLTDEGTNASAQAWFGKNDLRNPSFLHFALFRAWDDLLSDRGRRLLDAMQNTAGPGGDPVRADEVKAFADIPDERVKTLGRALDVLNAEHKKTLDTLNDHRREQEREIALLKREVEELKKGRDVWGGRAFTIVMSLVSVAVGGLITYYVRKP